MKKIRKVPTIEVKRTFVIPNLIRTNKNRRYLGKVTKEYFEKRLEHAKRRGLKLSERQLDKIIHDEYPKRLRAYDNSDWYLGAVTSSEVGVWKKAGGLPLAWTNGSLQETATKVRYALKTNSKSLKKRSRYAVTNMLKTNVQDLQKEKYLFPIIFKGGTGTRGRARLRKQMKGDIDDGCMRSVTLAVSGVKKIKVYIGFPKKIKK